MTLGGGDRPFDKGGSMKVIVLLLSLFMFLVNCSAVKDKKSPAVCTSDCGAEEVQVRSLEGMSFSEVIEEKYQRITYDCALYVQQGEGINISLEPNDIHTWNLLELTEANYGFSMFAEMANLSFRANVTVDKKSIVKEAGLLVEEGHMAHDGLESGAYLMKHTPRLQGAVTSHSRLAVAGEPVVSSETSDYGSPEKMEHPLVQKTYRGQEGEPDTHVLMTCTLKTQAKSEYADHFRKVE